MLIACLSMVMSIVAVTLAIMSMCQGKICVLSFSYKGDKNILVCCVIAKKKSRNSVDDPIYEERHRPRRQVPFYSRSLEPVELMPLPRDSFINDIADV